MTKSVHRPGLSSKRQDKHRTESNQTAQWLYDKAQSDHGPGLSFQQQDKHRTESNQTAQWLYDKAQSDHGPGLSFQQQDKHRTESNQTAQWLYDKAQSDHGPGLSFQWQNKTLDLSLSACWSISNHTCQQVGDHQHHSPPSRLLFFHHVFKELAYSKHTLPKVSLSQMGRKQKIKSLINKNYQKADKMLHWFYLHFKILLHLWWLAGVN